MKNKLADLNNHLFAQLERLSDEELAGDRLVEEMGRAKTGVIVAEVLMKICDRKRTGKKRQGRGVDSCDHQDQ